MEDKDRIDELEKLVRDLNQKVESQKPRTSVKKIIAIVLLCLQGVGIIGNVIAYPIVLQFIAAAIGYFLLSIIAVILLHIDYKQKKNYNETMSIEASTDLHNTTGLSVKAPTSTRKPSRETDENTQNFSPVPIYVCGSIIIVGIVILAILFAIKGY